MLIPYGGRRFLWTFFSLSCWDRDVCFKGIIEKSELGKKLKMVDKRNQGSSGTNEGQRDLVLPGNWGYVLSSTVNWVGNSRVVIKNLWFGLFTFFGGMILWTNRIWLSEKWVEGEKEVIRGIEKSMHEDQEAGESIFIFGYAKYVSESPKVCYFY